MTSLTAAMSQVKKKTREVKNALVTRIRDAAQQYKRVYVFDVENMKNSTMKEVREQWDGSKSVQHSNITQPDTWSLCVGLAILWHVVRCDAGQPQH